MRDLIDHHASDMMLDLTGERREVPPIGRGAPAEPADGGPAVSTHAGCGEGRNAAHEASDATRDAMRAGAQHYVVMDGATADALRLAATMAVGAVWDQAVSLAAEAGPMPLVGTEAWEEEDTDYASRYCRHRSLNERNALSSRWMAGASDDDIGATLGILRARLVRGPDRIADLDRVEMLVAVENDRGTSVPAGTQGTVVGIWAGGQAYEVELWNGVDEYGYSLATVAAESLRLVSAEDAL